MAGSRPLVALAALMLLAATGARAADGAAYGVDAARAETNYMLHCRGCHGPAGVGANGRVPRMKDHVARFLSVPGGREYLLRVPGAANAPLSNARLAELMNWILVTQDPEHLPKDFRPYTAAEVGRWRKKSFVEVTLERHKFVDMIDAQNKNQGTSE